MGVHSPIFDKIENIFGRFPKPSEMTGKEKIMSEKNDKKESQRTRKKRIFFRVDDEELKFIQARMNLLHIKNREAYLRKMAIDGQCIRYDYSDLENEIRKNNYLMSNAAKNINQIAKRINSTSDFYEADLLDLQEKVEAMMKQQVEICLLYTSDAADD